MDQVQEYSLAGFALVVLDGKVPLASEKGFPDFQPDALLTEADFARYNWGVVLKHEDLVIDVDPRGFRDGDNPLKRLFSDANVDPDSIKDASTLVVRTGSGGLHIYLKKPASQAVRGKLRQYPGLDFKTYGGYVVGAGSTHPDTHEKYTKLYGSSPHRITPCPSTILSLLEKEVVDAKTLDEAIVDDSEPARQRFVEILVAQPDSSEGERADAIYRMSCRGRDLGLPASTTLELIAHCYNAAKTHPPLDEDELDRTVKSAYKYAKNTQGADSPISVFEGVTDALPYAPGYDPYSIVWDYKADKTLKATLGNCLNHIMTATEICESVRFNSLSYNIEVDGKLPWHTFRVMDATWDDNDALQLKTFLNRRYRLEYSTSTIHEAVATAAMRRHYHPVKQYLEALAWDRTPRLGNWLATYCGVTDNEYSRAVGRKLLAAAITRVYHPGHKFDYLTVLEGIQGVGKSTVVKILGGKWAADIYMDPRSKDTVDAMRGKWFIEVSEMEVMRRADNQALKAFISRSVDRCRMAYARNTVDYPRQCVFVGTINPTEAGYLSDETGNRRYWPVYCAKIDMDALARDRDQIFAETFYRLRKAPEILTIDQPLAAVQALEAQSKRLVRDPWVEYIGAYFDQHPDITEITGPELLLSVFGTGPKSVSRGDLCRMGRALSDLGWTKHHRGPGGAAFYRRPIGEVV